MSTESHNKCHIWDGEQSDMIATYTDSDSRLTFGTVCPPVDVPATGSSASVVSDRAAGFFCLGIMKSGSLGFNSET